MLSSTWPEEPVWFRFGKESLVTSFVCKRRHSSVWSSCHNKQKPFHTQAFHFKSQFFVTCLDFYSPLLLSAGSEKWQLLRSQH